MKRVLFSTLLGAASCATYQVQPSHVATDNFVVLRKGYNSSASRMQVYVDNQLIGKMTGYRYLSGTLPAGPHEVYFKFNPLVSRSARRSFTTAAGEKKVFTVQKGLIKYGVAIVESDTLPTGIAEKKAPKVREDGHSATLSAL